MAVRLGALLGTVVSVDRRTVDRENLEYMCVRVEIPILRPLIPGAFLRLENGDPIWVHFSYERVFKACFKCGCVGHMPNHCHYSTAYASIMIHERIQEVQQFPHNAFWVQDDWSLYQRALKAIKNSNLNRTSRLETLWSELEMGAIETENALGIRTVFFMRHHNFSEEEEDGPSDPSEDMDEVISDHNTEPVHSGSPPHSPPASPHGSVAASVDGDAKNLEHLEALTREERHFGLDATFEQELNSLGLTCLIDHPLPLRKRPLLDAGEGSAKRAKYGEASLSCKPRYPPYFL